jgi:hypothetical protein
MTPNKPVYHIIRSFVLRRSPDGRLFELPTRYVEEFEKAFDQQSNEETQRRFNKYMVH